MGLPRAKLHDQDLDAWPAISWRTLDHDGTTGDGEAPWDLVSRNGQDIASGRLPVHGGLVASATRPAASW